MIPGMAAGLIAFSVCVALTPAVRELCLRFGAVDHPGALKIHSRPIPRLGGIAVALAIAAALCLAAPLQGRAGCFFLAAFATIWLVGLADDLRSLPPIVRLAGQIVSGVLLWVGGWRLSAGPEFPRDGVASLLGVCAVVVVFANAFNFLDGSDGIAAGVAALAASSYLIVLHAVAPDPLVSVVTCALLGACVAFLIFNAPPANIFLGDSGSTVLGFCIALLSFKSASSAGAFPLCIVPFTLAGLPLLDAALALVRRIANRSSPLHGDRRHFYDLLLARRWSQRTVALTCYGITLALGFVAWLGTRLSVRAFEVLSALSFAGLLLLCVTLGSMRVGDKMRGNPDQAFRITPS